MYIKLLHGIIQNNIHNKIFENMIKLQDYNVGTQIF